MAIEINLQGKLALVTGGAGELGRVITRTLARCGADVAIHYLSSRSKAEALAQDIRALGRRAEPFAADITEPEDVLRLHAEVAKGLGEPDIIVLNAVIQYQWQHILQQPVEDYESQFRSCVLHAVLMAKAFVPAMIRKKWGRVIAINTECAMQCAPNQSAYAAAKRGMDGIVRVLAKEVGEHGITVNEVAPGWMISERYRTTGTERQPDYEKNVPLRHRGQDQDIANAVSFLASDLAAFISGAYLPVSGGNVMPGI